MKHLSNDQLILEIKHLVKEETRLTSRILDYLKEVEFRKIYLKMGYPSLFEFCIKELKYSEGSTQRRISAMRLMKEVPEIRDKIISGELNLSTASQAQIYFKNQAKKQKTLSKQEKLEVLKDIENTSTRECEKKLLKLDPEQVRKDRERAVTHELTELKLTVDQEFMQMLEELKNILSHAKPAASTKEILKFAMQELLLKKKPKMNAEKKTKESAKEKEEETISSVQQSPPAAAVKAEDRVGNKTDDLTENKNKKRNRHISVRLKQEVMKKHNDQCCYEDPVSGRRCTAKRFAECDHIIPFSKGGQTIFENLQVLCSAHNKLKSDYIP